MSQAAMEPPPGVTANLEHPTDVIRTINFVTQALTLTLCTFFVLVRVIQKFRLPTLHVSFDDYITLLAWIFLVGYCISGIALSVHDGGYHIWEVPAETLVHYLKAMYAATIFYALMTLFIKLSLLALIAKVFSPYRQRVYALYAFAGLITVYYIISLILKIRVCAPVSAYWNGHPEKCLDQSKVITADAIISTVTDTIILVMPLPLTWNLQLPTRKKLRVGGMLAVGGLATAFSAWRLHLIVTDGASTDATILYVQVVLSGNAEAGIALICTCLPAAVGQFKFLRDRVGYGSSRGTKTREATSSAGDINLTSTRRGDNGKKKKTMTGTVTSLDEVELVTHAQGGLTQDRDGMDSHGITRKVEVTHAVTYASDDSDSYGKDDISRTGSKVSQ